MECSICDSWAAGYFERCQLRTSESAWRHRNGSGLLGMGKWPSDLIRILFMRTLLLPITWTVVYTKTINMSYLQPCTGGKEKVKLVSSAQWGGVKVQFKLQFSVAWKAHKPNSATRQVAYDCCYWTCDTMWFRTNIYRKLGIEFRIQQQLVYLFQLNWPTVNNLILATVRRPLNNSIISM